MENNLHLLIASKNIQITKLARDLNVSRNSIYRMLNGKPPSAELMLKVAKYFEKEVSEIFFTTGVQQIVQMDKKGA